MMKVQLLKAFAFLLAAVLVCGTLTSCSEVDDQYGVESEPSESVSESTNEIPTIRSTDKVMPLYFDISRYDEENDADIYLGKKYEFKFTYAGDELELPLSCKELTKKGWEILGDAPTPDTVVKSGETVEVLFSNEYQKQLKCVFKNNSNSSLKLKKCDLVRVVVAENVLLNSESTYGQFWLNGVTNHSAVTDVVEYLGAPSHFYAVSENEYYFDYYLSKEDKHSGITVHIDVGEDSVTAIEIFN